MGRDHSELTSAAKTAKKKGKPDKTVPSSPLSKPTLPISSPKSSPLSKPTLPIGSPKASPLSKPTLGSVSDASTATSTPQQGLKSPSGGILDAVDLFSLPESNFDCLQEGATCTICGGHEQQQAQLYCCQHAYVSHRFLACSQRCAKKFEKECARTSEAKRKQTTPGKHAAQLTCPSCRSALTMHEIESIDTPCSATHDAKSPTNVQSSPTNGKGAGSPVHAFLPAELLPSKSDRRTRRLEPMEESAPALSQKTPLPALELEEIDSDLEVPPGELEEARALVVCVTEEVAGLEKQLLQLSGKEHRNERNKTNQRIFTLKNMPEVTAAKRLVRDPLVEWRRRRDETRAREAEAAKHAEAEGKVQEVVRCRLARALGNMEESHDSWKLLLQQGHAVGLAKDDDVIVKITAHLEALQEQDRLKKEIIAEQKRQSELEEQERKLQLHIKAAVHEYIGQLLGRITKSQEVGGPKKRAGKGKGFRSGKGFVRGVRLQDFGKSAGKSGGGKNGGKIQRSVEKPFAADRYKTNLCRAYELGTCVYGNACSFAHGLSELRKSQQPPWRNRAPAAAGGDQFEHAGHSALP